MTAITILGDPFPDWQEPVHRHAIADLTRALAKVAPRGCSVQYLYARGAQPPVLESPLISVTEIPLRASRLPILWQASATATPLDDSFVHSHTPLAPLRQRKPGDLTQNTVFVPHTIPWEAPDLLGSTTSRLYKRFVKRAVKYANVIFTPTHEVADLLLREYGEDIDVRVLPLAAPSIYTEPVAEPLVELPESYIVTAASPSETGRLDWVLDALRQDADGHELVILTGLGPNQHDFEVPGDLAGRVHLVSAETGDYRVVSQVLAGACALAMPDKHMGVGYIAYAALAHGVPVVHGGTVTLNEAVLDAGAAADSAEQFASELIRVCGEEKPRLRLLALDRARGFNWEQTAWQLWETHANL